MKTVLLVLVLAASAAAQLGINPISHAVQCEPLAIIWDGGIPNQSQQFILQSVEASPSLTTVVQFDQQNDTSLTWPVVDVAVGQQLVILVKDATGGSATSAIFSVSSGSSSTVFSSSAQSSSSQTISSTTPPSSPTNPGSQTSPQANHSSHQANQPSSPATSSSPSASQSSVPANTDSPVVGGKKKKSLIGPIVGGAVGGSFVVLGALGLLLLCRTRREDGPAFPDGFDEMQKQPPAQNPPVMNSLAGTPQTQWSPEQLFTTLPTGETQLSSLAAPIVPRGILAGEEKAQRAAADRLGLLQKEVRELHELADASTVGSTSRAESSNADLLNEIRMLREQMHTMEQRIQAPMGQPDMEDPPEYTKES
ncbi:hypothetical protein C8R45DRAFT_1068273 [Mycena sanguinolenta]|nr:hypothetical protein C8R45DRAFT_1068273 [Mycena sanguinolenta]